MSEFLRKIEERTTKNQPYTAKLMGLMSAYFKTQEGKGARNEHD